MLLNLGNKTINKTPLYSRHIELGAKMVDFGGWLMPLQYQEGIASEHISTRKSAGLFDISHMGRLVIKGNDAVAFLQYVLTSNVSSLEVGESHYTIFSDDEGVAIDDAYLYRFYGDEYILVVNAANKNKDLKHLIDISKEFKDIKIIDRTYNISMLSLQGPRSKEILLALISSGHLPEPLRNNLSSVKINNIEVLIARTGYTGEPVGFELFTDSKFVEKLWNLLYTKESSPVGLGARDTLRLEAGLPLYGHELGCGVSGKKIPIFSSAQSRIAVSFSPLKGNYIGKKSLEKQFEALKRIQNRDYSRIKDLPQIIMPLELLEKGVARPGDKVYFKESEVGQVTSGTAVPFLISKEIDGGKEITDKSDIRSIALALVDSRRWEQDIVEVEVRGKLIKAIVMPYLLRSEAPPYAYTITSEYILKEGKSEAKSSNELEKAKALIENTIENTKWRQRQCINLIPSEMSPSRLVRMLSIMDPIGRYAEHKKIKAYQDMEVFYYQGTQFIAHVEELIAEELKKYLDCSQIEARIISGQMANTAVFSAIVDYLNRTDKKSEPKRISQVLNHHIIKGGHLSSQPMGALKDFVANDPVTEKPAVVDFPTLKNNPYKIDIEETKNVIQKYRPELIIFGKSMMLYKEPVAEIKAFVDEIGFDCILMYDMAHVLGLVGPYFQKPFSEGADIVTGSTHKTFFGTQRGVIASCWQEPELKYKLWEAIESRSFPGSVSNHHLGTLLGLLAACYEMNYFRDCYQKQIILNAQAFAGALDSFGLAVAGDKDCGFTQTHQVIVEVGLYKGQDIAKKLEENNIITNYQATPEEEGFTAAGAIRMGVAEMTRFGMREKDFQLLAEYIYEVVVKGRKVKDKIIKLRYNFLDMQYCFKDEDLSSLNEKLYNLI